MIVRNHQFVEVNDSECLARVGLSFFSLKDGDPTHGVLLAETSITSVPKALTHLQRVGCWSPYILDGEILGKSHGVFQLNMNGFQKNSQGNTRDPLVFMSPHISFWTLAMPFACKWDQMG